MTTLYTAHATCIAGRDGHVETDDKVLSVKLSNPDNKEGTNPEQLFACAYGACFGSALKSVAESENLKIDEIKINVSISLNKEEEKGYFLSAELEVFLPNIEKSLAEQLTKKAHQVCPYSKATRGNIEVAIKVNNVKIDT